MAEDSGENRKQGRGHNIGELVRRLGELESKVASMASPIIKCAFCKGTGREPDANGEPKKDDNDNLMLCRVCNGHGKICIR